MDWKDRRQEKAKRRQKDDPTVGSGQKRGRWQENGELWLSGNLAVNGKKHTEKRREEKKTGHLVVEKKILSDFLIKCR